MSRENYYEDSFDIFRMEKSVISKENMDNIVRLTNDKVAEALLYYICNEHQYNIFGYGKIDPVVFAEKFGFSERYLREPHPDPFWKTFYKVKDEKKSKTAGRRRTITKLPSYEYTNRLENALFVLAHLPLMVRSTVVDDNKRLVTRNDFIQILDTLYVIQDKITGKIDYIYKLNERFRRNLSTYYLKTSTQSLVKLRKPGYELLYQCLLRIKESLFSKGLTSTPVESAPSFKYLCELVKIKEQDAKYMKRNLNLALKKIKEYTELTFEVEWIKGHDQSDKYTPIFHFIPALGEVLGPNSHHYQAIRFDERIDVACVEFKHQLYELCPKKGYEDMDRAEEIFFDWLKKTDEQHKKRLRNALEKTFINLACVIPNDLDSRIDYFMNKAQTEPRENFDQWVLYVFKSPAFKFPKMYQIQSVDDADEQSGRN